MANKATKETKTENERPPIDVEVEDQVQDQALVSYEQQMKDMVAGIHNTISSPERRFIKTKGKIFTFPDDHTETSFDGIIVNYVSTNTYYAEAYNPNNIVPPTCFAIGENPHSMVPSDNSPQKQAASCGECPMNQWGSDGKGKACKNGRLLAILPPAPSADDAPVFLRVPPTSLRAFDTYVAKLASVLGRPPVGVVTTISVDESSDYLKLKFEAKGNNENVGIAMDRLPEVKDLLMQEPDLSKAA